MRRWLGIAALLSVSATSASLPVAKEAGAPTLSAHSLRFEPNVGQLAAGAFAVARHGNAVLVARADEALLSVRGHDSATTLRLHVAGGHAVTPVLEAPEEGVTNYFVGDDPRAWKTDVPGFARLRYPAVRDGVDLVFHGEEGQLEYDFVLAPGHDAREAVLEVEGARALSLTASGELAIHTPEGDLLQPRPRVYQHDPGGTLTEVAASYRLVGSSAVGFELAAYDTARELVIDPILKYGTLLGGSATESDPLLAVGPSGSAFLLADTPSADVAVTPGSFGYGGGSDVVLAKYGTTGALVFATYLGGSAADTGLGIAVDAAGQVVVGGATQSTDLPATLPDQSLQGDSDGFLARFDRNGVPVYVSYLGAEADDAIEAVAVSGNDTVIAGTTVSTTLPTTDASAPGGGTDAFVARVSATGEPAFLGYLGGSGDETAVRVGTDGGGSLIVAGSTDSPDFTVVEGAAAHGSTDVFVAKYSAGNGLVFATCLGGSGAEDAAQLAVASTGAVVIGGQTQSVDLDTSAGALGRGGSSDGFVVRLAAAGTTDFASYLGGSGADTVRGLTLDTNGNAVVAGTTSSNDFPTTAGTRARGQGADGFVTSFAPDGHRVYSTYLGGNAQDDVNGAAADALGNVFVVGGTHSSNFPVTGGSLAHGSVDDAFVVKLGPTGASLYSTFLGGNGDDEATAVRTDPMNQVVVLGLTTSQNFPVTNGAAYHGAGDLFLADLTGTPLTISPDSPTVVPLGSQQFTAAGEGDGPFVFEMGNNPSGGSVTADGAYSAGPIGGVIDEVRVTNKNDETTVTANVTVSAGVSVTAGSTAVAPLETTQVVAVGGNGAPYTYTMVPPSTGTVSAAGLYKAGSGGGVTDTVKATDSLGNTGTVEIAVGASIAVTPPTASVTPRESITFRATGGSNSGYTWGLPSSQPVLPSGGSITPQGVYTAGNVGGVTDRVRVTDSLGNGRSAVITVGPNLKILQTAPSTTPRGSIAFSSANGHGVVSWKIEPNQSGGSIAGGTGAYTAGSVGSTKDTVVVTDDLGNVASVEVSVGAGVSVLGTRGVAPQESLTLSATGGSGHGYTFALSASPSGGSLAGNVYTAGTEGSKTDQITATDSLGNTAVASIVVGPGLTIGGLAATPPNGTLEFTASGGKAPYSWQVTESGSGNPTITAAGVYTAGDTGSKVDTIAVHDAFNNVATISVSVGGGLVITPNAPTRAPGSTTTFAASGGDGGPYTWSKVDAGSGGNITAGGVYTAGHTGPAVDHMRVTDGLGNKRDVTITVSRGVSISSSISGVAPRGTSQLTAAGGSGTGFSWDFVTNGSGGTVSATGAYRAGTKGDTNDVLRVRDSLANVATFSIAVSAALVVTPGQSNAPPKGELNFAATGGAQPYRYALQTNASQGTMTEASGHYRAGPKPAVQDIVSVTDANGVVVTSTVFVGTGVTATPSVAIVSPNGSLAFAASGGSGTGYSWLMVLNASGSSIDAATGTYTAGSTSEVVDVIRLTDSLTNSVDVSIVVGDALIVSASKASVAPRESLSISVTGGSGEYQFSFGANASGGTIDASTGDYVAGPVGNVTDAIVVADRVGNQAFVNLAVGPGLTITPPGLTVKPGEGTTFAVAGGSGLGYAWSLQSNASAATIDPVAATYVAGVAAGTDVVKVVDSLGNEATANVTVATPPVTTPPGGDGGVDTPGEGGGAGDDEGGGCATVAIGHTTSPITFGWLAGLAALVLRRLRRRG